MQALLGYFAKLICGYKSSDLNQNIQEMNSHIYSLNMSTPDDIVYYRATTSNLLGKISSNEGDWRKRKKGNLMSRDDRITLATPANTDNLNRLTADISQTKIMVCK